MLQTGINSKDTYEAVQYSLMLENSEAWLFTFQDGARTLQKNMALILMPDFGEEPNVVVLQKRLRAGDKSEAPDPCRPTPVDSVQKIRLGQIDHYERHTCSNT